MLINNLLQAQNSQGLGGSLGMMLLLFGVMFVFFILPQMRKQKKAKQFLETLKKGDRIVTSGGVHAKITGSNEQTFTLETESGKMVVEKTAISAELTQARYSTTAAAKDTKASKEEVKEDSVEEAN